MGYMIDSMGSYPPGVTDNDPHFNLDGDEDSDEPDKCAVYECEKPQAPRDIYCPVHRAEATEFRGSYEGAKLAGMVEGQ